MKKDKVIEYIVNTGLDTIIFTTPKNIEYLTGFSCDPHERALMYVINKKGDEFILCPKLEEEVAKKSTENINIIGYLDTENPYIKLHEFTNDILNLGIEKEHITVLRYEAIIDVFKVENIKDVSHLIRDLRKKKSKLELEFMREAANLADKCMEIAANNIRKGITELELKSTIENEIKKYGVSKMSFDTIVLFGEMAANPHGESSNRALKDNEYVLIDLGCYYKGYASDITRCMPFGKVSDFDKSIYDLVLKANTEAIKAVKPGVSFAYIDKIARDIITEAGYGEYFNHRLGHGLGMDCHEYPDVSQKTTDLLEVGMTFTIEPGIYIPNKVGIRIEDDIYVTENGYEVLTKYPK
ncbi:M24 family metallopeptidase [Streptobacillus moniliformis]|uniref:M24 family metallopeptidase n=1 Tax=Streptobacillus moniliformis TaxID=34105 RepID=UPI0007E46C77|nr:Xaa-Pro peptidase family protein [Streptobacillus moniliformis]